MKMKTEDNFCKDIVPKIKREFIDESDDYDEENEEFKKEVHLVHDVDKIIKKEPSFNSDCDGYLDSKMNIINEVSFIKDLVLPVKEETESESLDQVSFLKELVLTIKKETESESLDQGNLKQQLVPVIKKMDPISFTNQDSSSLHKRTCSKGSNETNSSELKDVNNIFNSIENKTRRLFRKTEGNLLQQLVPVIKKLDPTFFTNQENPSSIAIRDVLGIRGTRKSSQANKNRSHLEENEQLSIDKETTKTPTSRTDPNLDKSKLVVFELSDDEDGDDNDDPIAANKKLIQKMNKYIRQKERDQKYILTNTSKKKINGKKYNMCKICKFQSDHHYNFMVHMLKHSGEKPYVCKVCGKSFTTLVKARAHLQIHFGKKKFKCEVCSYRCRDKGNLKVHMRIHTGEKPFKCKFCNDSFKQATHLKIHFRKHTNEKPYKCPYCVYCCKDPTSLKVHKRVHTGEKPYKCEYCDFAANQAQCLKSHINSFHLKRVMKCNDCDYKSKYRSHLINHINRVHLLLFKQFCDECKFVCKSKLGLLKHKKRKHSAKT